MKKLILVLISLCLWSSAGLASDKNMTTSLSRVEEYDLSERCGKQAEALFKMRNFLTNGNAPKPNVLYKNKDGKGFTSYDFQNHYNKKLNKCFVLLEETFSDNGKDITGYAKTLYDANEHKQYADYLCDYPNRTCPP